MDQAAHPPVFRHPSLVTTGWHDALTSRQSHPTAAEPANTPFAEPAAVGPALHHAQGDGLARREVMARLRHAIAEIERPPPLQLPDSNRAKALWRLGCPKADHLLPLGLDQSGVHEVKAAGLAQGASAADWMTSLGFALRLAVRRLNERPPTEPRWLMWCWPRSLARELGAPSALGLAQLGIDPSRLILVETARDSEALIALEDALRSSSLALAFGIFDEIALTPSRRLSLAASELQTPCLLITHPQSEPAAAAATRWRIRRKVSAPHSLVPRLPGAMRFEVALERCRARPANSAHPPMTLEWSDETHSFSLASSLADRPAETRHTRRGAR